MSSLCIDITSTPTFPESNAATYETVELEENTSYTTATLKITVPSTEAESVIISNLKVNGLPENLIPTYFLPSGQAFDPSKQTVSITPGNEGPSIKIGGTLSNVYDNNRIFKVTVSFGVLCGPSEVSNVDLNWFAIKTKKTSSNTLLIILIVVLIIVVILIVFSVLMAYYFKNKKSLDFSRSVRATSSSSSAPSLSFSKPSLSSKIPMNSLYYNFI